MSFFNRCLQVFDVCDVSDHSGGDELCDSPKCLPENPKHPRHDRQNPQGDQILFSEVATMRIK